MDFLFESNFPLGSPYDIEYVEMNNPNEKGLVPQIPPDFLIHFNNLIQNYQESLKPKIKGKKKVSNNIPSPLYIKKMKKSHQIQHPPLNSRLFPQQKSSKKFPEKCYSAEIESDNLSQVSIHIKTIGSPEKQKLKMPIFSSSFPLKTKNDLRKPPRPPYYEINDNFQYFDKSLLLSKKKNVSVGNLAETQGLLLFQGIDDFEKKFQ